MAKQFKLLKPILYVAGIIEIAAGLLHFAMPEFAYRSKGFSLLQQGEIDFVTPVVFSVGILLVAFGSLTTLFAMKIESTILLLYYYLVIKTALWTARIVLELLYPVNLNMFNVEPFTTVVLPGLVFELLLFVISLTLARKIVRAKCV